MRARVPGDKQVADDSDAVEVESEEAVAGGLDGLLDDALHEAGVSS